DVDERVLTTDDTDFTDRKFASGFSSVKSVSSVVLNSNLRRRNDMFDPSFPWFASVEIPFCYFVSAASFSFAFATTASVVLSVSKTELSPCGSQKGSPVKVAADSGLPAAARPSPPQVQKFAPCNARPALHESAT